MNQILISQIDTWGKYKREIVLVIREALVILQGQANLPDVEAHAKKHSLNRELFRCFRAAVSKHRLPHHLPIPEGRNPPSVFDPEPTEREAKIPDFYWQFVDVQNDKERRYVLECKRLGSPPTAGWKLNENYVQNGIYRFTMSPHEYGKDDDTCGMVGYIQNMEFEEILHQVNGTLSANPEPISLLQISSDGWQANGVSELVHDLERPFPVSPFRMHHFWVDIRNTK